MKHLIFGNGFIGHSMIYEQTGFKIDGNLLRLSRIGAIPIIQQTDRRYNQAGNNFNDYLKDTIISKVRIKDINDICVEIEKYKPQVVINCIGKTGIPNVDWCESHKEETFFSNVTVPTYMAEVCENAGLYMVHMGSGCIYEGDRRYTEGSTPNFKVTAGQKFILSRYCSITIIFCRLEFACQ